MKLNKITALLALPLLILLSACSKHPPAEVAIAENIEAIQSAIEDKNRSDVMLFLTDNFTANGYLNKEELGKMLLLQFLAHNKISVTVVSSDIQIEPGHTDLAQAKLAVIVTGATRLIPDDGRIYQVTSSWQLNDGDWLLDRLNWE